MQLKKYVGSAARVGRSAVKALVGAAANSALKYTKRKVRTGLKKAVRRYVKGSSKRVGRRVAKRVNNKKLSKSQKAVVRKIASKVLHGEMPIGFYEKNLLGIAPYNYAGTSSDPAQTVFRQGCRGHIGQLSTDMDFAVGKLYHVVDAASVLWSTKTAALYSTTGNIDPAQIVVPDFKEVLDTMFVNNSNIAVEMLFYEMTPKEDTNTDVLTNWDNCDTTTPQQGGTNRPYSYFGMTPDMYPRMKDQYTFLKKTVVTIQPCQSYVYTMSVQTKHLRFDDWIPIGDTVPVSYRKGFTKELLVIQRQLVCGQQETTTSPKYMGVTWNPAYSSGVGEEQGIGICQKRRFTMRCPEQFSNTVNKDNVFAVFSLGVNGVKESSTTTYQNKSLTLLPPAI